ncbi:ABC transporter substrate-binding protein [bacterium]|nr:ABC transporter substrate-binding protein [bacterium]
MLTRNRTARSWVPQFFRFIFVFVCCIGPAVALERVSLQLRWMHQFQFAGYYAALHQGFYREAGLEVTLKEGGPGVDPVSDVLAGQADFGVSNSSLVIKYLNGNPVLLLGPIFQHSPNILLMRGRVENPSELVAAGRVALMGGIQDVELKAMFLNEGIALEKVDFVADRQHLADLIAGQVVALYAYLSNEPFELEQKGIAYSVLKPQTYGMDFYGDALFTRQALDQERPEVVAAFRAASIRGWEYALEHPDEIIDLILARYNTQGKSRAHLQFEAKTLKSLINPELIQIGHSDLRALWRGQGRQGTGGLFLQPEPPSRSHLALLLSAGGDGGGRRRGQHRRLHSAHQSVFAAQPNAIERSPRGAAGKRSAFPHAGR